MRTSLSTTVRALCLAIALPAGIGNALAYDAQSTAAINVDENGVGLHGYDPVAFFKQGRALAGSNAYSAVHDGVIYHFADAADRDAFRAAPQRYAPQFGGFCAMGVAMGKKFDIDPQAWRVVDGRLNMNMNPALQKRWLEDVPGNLQQAQENWPKLRHLAPQAL